MIRFPRAAARWVGRHAFPAAAAGVIAVGAAGGGVGYAVAGQHSTAAPVSSMPGPTSKTPASSAKTPSGATRGERLVQRALGLLAAQTGQTAAAVRSQLEAGKSIDDIAGAKAPAIRAAILAAVGQFAARAVSAGRITAAQEATALAMAQTKVDALMAEPGTQLIKDVQQLLQMLKNHGASHGAARAAPSPA